ncbi:MAG: hypothetical protein RMJ97_11245 [Raineya sp.]|nr:hypothetical protein [Raineya sp.]
MVCRNFLDDVEYRIEQIKGYFKDVFSESRIRNDFQRKGKIIIEFRIDKNGNVLEVKFAFNKELSVTPQEINLLESKMKQVKFREIRESSKCKDVSVTINYIPITDVVSFETLYP